MKKLGCMVVLLLQRGFLLVATDTTTSNSGGSEAMPWDTPLEIVSNALSGNTLRIISIILIVVAGIFIATSEGSGVKKKGAWIIIGIAVAANAASVFDNLFGTAGGTLLW